MVDTGMASRLLSVTPQAVRKNIGAKKLTAQKSCGAKGGGTSGIAHLIPLDELPTEARIKYQLMAEGSTSPDADLAAYRERYGEEGLEKLMGRLNAVMEMRLLTQAGDTRAPRRREEIAQRLGVKARCVYDWERKYAQNGLEGLMDKTMRSDKGRSRALCLLAQDRVNYLYMAPGKLSQNRVLRTLTEMRDKLGEAVCEECCHNPESWNRQELIERGVDPGDLCKACGKGMILPGDKSSVNRYVAGLDKAVVTLGRYGDKPFDDLYIPKCRRDKPELVNETWFGDHHVFDLFVKDSNGVARRPWLTACSDALSGAIVAWQLSFNPNSKTIMESLALGIAKTKGSPFSGPPMCFYCDNGKDYRCKLIEGTGDQTYQPGKINGDITDDNALLKCFGIGVTHALPYRGRSKPIERIFGIIESEWIKGLPGYCGNGIDIKPEKLMADIRAGRLMTFEEFAALWINTILPQYHAFKGEDGVSPMELYESHEKARKEVIGWPMLSMAMSEKCQRAVRTDGVWVDKVRYWDAALALHIKETVQVLRFQHVPDFVGIMLGGRFVCIAQRAENFKMLGEDEERLKEHLRMQASTRKVKLAALRLPAQRVRVLDNMAMELPDLAQAATVTSMVHERAYRELREAQQEKKEKEAFAREAGKTLRKRIHANGNAVLDMPDVD